MSTCTTATAAHRGHAHVRSLRRRLFCGDDDGEGDTAGQEHNLEARLTDLKRDWNAYKASAPRHRRRSRSALTGGTPSSAVTAADDALSEFLRCSPRRLVYSVQLQQDDDDGGGGAVVSAEPGNGGGGSQLREDGHDDEASSVCSVEEAARPVSSASSSAATPSSAVTAAGPADADAALSDFLRCSPRRLVYSLQQDDDDDIGGVAAKPGNGGGQFREDDDDDGASSVFSVEAARPVSSSSSSRSCPRQRAALCRSRSTSPSSCTEATGSEFAPAGGGEGGTVHAGKTEDVSSVTGSRRVKWFAAIAFVVVGVVVAMTVFMELGMDDEDFIVPT